MIDRRAVLKLSSAAVMASISPSSQSRVIVPPPFDASIFRRASAAEVEKPDFRIEIGTSVVELGKDTAVSTKTYNSGFPGPLLRLTEGKPVVVDIHNGTDTPEQLHWHGQFLPVEVDGAAEEGTPFIPAHGMRRIAFTPGPAGFRFYHTHMTAGSDLSLGLYNGMAGPVYVEPCREPGTYDREVFLTLKEFAPFLNHSEMTTGFLAPDNKVRELYDLDQRAIAIMRERGVEPGWQLGYRFFSVNGRMLGEGEPIRVKAGERLLIHILNASATEIRSLALPGHVFKVVALDGNPVPTAADVPVLWLGPAERISAMVEMTKPGIWVMGDLDQHARMNGLGVVVEYAGHRGQPNWQAPDPFKWDYRYFSKSDIVSRPPDEIIELTFATQYAVRDGFDIFTINGVAFSMEAMKPLLQLQLGRRYRLNLRNATDDVHPIHLHRHSFELTSIAGMRTSGVVKDVVMIGGFQEMTIDFTADQRGLSLFHCHMQDHMDLGFMALFDCA